MMELSNILESIADRTIFVSGATGFLAKVFVEKILRVQPNVKKLYLLIRSSDDKSAAQRFNTEVIAKDLFKVLKEKCGKNFGNFISQKIVVVDGDITCENLGIKDPNLLEEMRSQIDVVVNVAASVDFDERYDVALRLNTYGAINVLDFAKKCANLNMFLHVSTAYVSGDKRGVMLETPYKLGETLNGTSGLDLDEEKTIMEKRLKELQALRATGAEMKKAMKILGIERANKHGWPNTYVFTKALAEMLIGHLKGDMPVVILRPTMITSTYKEPFPGWSEGVRTIDSLALGYAKGKLTCFLGNPESVVDVIPVDMVVNAMIVAMVAQANQPSETIYHVGSSVSNPLKFSRIQLSGYRYFRLYPWIGKDGKPVKVGEVTVLSSMESFRQYMAVRYVLPLKGLQLVNMAFCQYFKSTYVDLNRKIKFVMRLVELYRPYLFSESFYDDTNTETLRKAVGESGNEEDMFYFDPKSIHWEDYFFNTHFPGLVKYVF